MIIKFKDVEYVIFTDNDLKNIFKNFVFENMRHPINFKYLNLDINFLPY